jgi:hypothetical protein
MAWKPFINKQWSPKGTYNGYHIWVNIDRKGKPYYNVTKSREPPLGEAGYYNLGYILRSKGPDSSISDQVSQDLSISDNISINRYKSFLLEGQLPNVNIKYYESGNNKLIILAVMAIALGMGISLNKVNNKIITKEIVNNKQQIETLLSNPQGKQEALEYLNKLKLTSKAPLKIDMIINEIETLNDPEDIDKILRSFNSDIINNQIDPRL